MPQDEPPGPATDVDLTAVLAALESGSEALAALAPPPLDPALYLDSRPGLRDVGTRDVAVHGPEGEVLARLYRQPSSAPQAALVWVHGGGFAAGDLDMAEAHWVGLALAAAGVSVLSLDYRKCLGGVHYPAPSDDVLAGWSWAVDHAAALGVSEDRLHLGGASAGASLAAGVAKRLRDGGGPAPASLVLVYPTVHPDLPAPSEEVARVTEELRKHVPPAIMAMMSLNYAGAPAALQDPYAFPGLGDVSGLPRTLVLNSEFDLLRASGDAFAAALAAAGVDVTVEHEPGSGHGHLNEPLTAPAGRSIDRLIVWLHPVEVSAG